ncbi:MAG TPA: D-2-hydroxyacid dehydrogenase family protein [Stellaceae bacterium]|nr:D-2-hydroxyacid dehydrogenase family protein [Stellaceae bacterium]
MRIAVLDDYQQAFATMAAFPRLADHEVVVFTDTIKEPVALAERLQGFDAVLLTQQRTLLTRATIERLDRLRLVAQTGRLTSHIDLVACSERGITVCGSPTGPSIPTMELTWALILASCRHIPEEAASIKAGRWQTTVGTGLSGKTLGVYAYGRIGSMVAKVGQAFGMRVWCWGRGASLEAAKADGFEAAPSREAFFAESDVVTLHLPLKPETRGIVKLDDLQRMQPDALLVNTSRGPLINQDDLVTALKAGRPGRAAIDVYDDEPITNPASQPLLALPNVLCTPHLGYVERGNYEKLYGGTVDAILAFAAGSPINVAKPT